MGVLIGLPKRMIRWRLRMVMAEKNIGNKELAEKSGLHPVHISRLKNADELKQITGETLNSLCDGLTMVYRERGENTTITPAHLIEYTFAEKEAV